MKTDNKVEMIEKYQCPGCVLGSDTKCGSYFLQQYGDQFNCLYHEAGTMIGFHMKTLLGMPKGFNKFNADAKPDLWFFENKSWGDDASSISDFPVWKAKHDGRTFLRVVQPIVGCVQTHVIDNIEGYDDIKCKDVADFEEEID